MHLSRNWQTFSCWSSRLKDMNGYLVREPNEFASWKAGEADPNDAG